MTEFETFFAKGEWAGLLASKYVDSWSDAAIAAWRESGGEGDFWPQMARTDVPECAQPSWDRRAAYMVWTLLRSRGLTGPSQGDLFMR